jgi:hypothetical protein
MPEIPVLEKLIQRVHRQYILREAESFREHKKGLSEWIKNSDDSYVRHEDAEGRSYSNLPIVLNFGRNEIMCLDFGGAEGKDVIEHVPYYGSPDAATQGKKLKREVSGGHGNGGKFYGLSQFDECQVIDLYEGKMTMLTLKKNGDVINYKNKPTDSEWLTKFLYLDTWEYFLVQEKILNAVNKGELNLFCWRGIGLKDKISYKRDLNRLIEAIRKNRQARPALSTRIVDILLYGKLYYHELRPIKIEIDESIGQKEFVLPNELYKYKFNKTKTSTLKISFSKQVLTGEDASLNILEIFSNGKPIGFYDIPSLLLDKGLSKYMYAEIDCPELIEYNCVSNDRTSLIEGGAGGIFKEWCKNKLKEVLTEQTSKEMRKEQDKNLEKVSEFINEVVKDLSYLLEEEALTQSYDKNSTRLATVLVSTDEIGGFGAEGKVKKKSGGKRKGKLGEKESNASEKPRKSVLKVLVSNKDEDPLNPGHIYNMIERQPVLYQRNEDVQYGIWWINSQKEYVRKLKIEQPAAKSFFCFLVKEIVLSTTYRKKYQEAGVDPDGFDELDFGLIDKVFNSVVQRLSIDVSEENISEKIRDAIRNKESFTAPQLSEELNIDPLYISTFLNTSKEVIKELFEIKKVPNPSGKGPKVNLYEKKKK